MKRRTVSLARPPTASLRPEEMGNPARARARTASLRPRTGSLRSRSTGLLAAVIALAAGASILAPAEAEAYCRMSSCTEKKAPWKVCAPAAPDDCGTPLAWQRACLGFSLQRDASSQVPLSEAKQVFKKAFDAWTRVECGGGSPGIAIEEMAVVQCSSVEYSTDKANANVVVFRDEAWPHDEESVLALTTVTYSMSSGEIYDADMEVNTADHHFTTDDKSPDIDLFSVATHEAGHFLGLAHSPDSEATMFAAYTPGTVGQRSLAADDKAAICAVYAPDGPSKGECDPTPRHGFSSLCAADQSEGSAGEGGSDGAGGDGEDGGGGSGGSGDFNGPVARACAFAPGSSETGSFQWTAVLALAACLGLVRSRRSR